jgi:DNA-binding MarR family transcriptional regulator
MISRALGQHMLLHVSREYGLSLAEYRVMTVLADRRSPSIRDIAANTDLDKAQVTRTLAHLVERGFVEQKVDANDRRLRDVSLTPAGQTVMKALDHFVLERQKRMERRLTRAKLDLLWASLDALGDEVESMLAEKRNAEVAGRQLRTTTRR